MELDKALGYAVILGWADLKKVSDPCSARAEYRSVAGAAVDYLSIWSVNDDGKQHMVCDYWTKTSPGHPAGSFSKTSSNLLPWAGHWISSWRIRTSSHVQPIRARRDWF